MQTILYPEPSQWEMLARRPVADLSDIEAAVRPILDGVRTGGDESLFKYTLEFDGRVPDALEVDAASIQAASADVSPQLQAAIRVAAGNIRKFHEAQQSVPEKTETTEGVTCWRKNVAIQRVGLYIPGGSAPLFSTVLMLAIPAAIAGCRDVVLCTPPGRDGRIHPAILFTAGLCGITRVFAAGGAQAIAAMAFGTESIPRVDKIFGPGNQYVTAAKQMVLRTGTAIDMPAGPSEVVVIADAAASPAFVAADLIAQAEHGADSQAMLLTDSAELGEAVVMEVGRQLAELPRREIARLALEHSKVLVFHDLETAMEFSNLYAPEHLILSVQDHARLADAVVTAGSVFLGPWTPESLGDYASGTNHTLPTNGFARAYSGVSLDSFVKKITFQEATASGLQKIGPVVEEMASGELLEGHRNAVSLRLKHLS